MTDILIKSMEMPKKDVNLIITAKGEVFITDCRGLSMRTGYKALEVPPHERLIGADQLQEVLNLTLSLVITNKLTDKEIELVHRTIGAISDAVNKMDTILEASNG